MFLSVTDATNICPPTSGAVWSQMQSNDPFPIGKAPVAEKTLDQSAIDAHDEHSGDALSATTMLLFGNKSFGSVCGRNALRG